MPISLIACVAIYKNQLAIGHDDNLLFKLKEDMRFFKNITSAQINNNLNVCVMGRNTYESIPDAYRPLSNRINIVLTNDSSKLIKTNFKDLFNKKNTKKPLTSEQPYYMKFEDFALYYKEHTYLNVFIIGGSRIYNIFLNPILMKVWVSYPLTPTKLYITHVLDVKKSDFAIEPNKFMDNFDNSYKLISYSNLMTDNGKKFRFLTYNLNTCLDADETYKRLMKDIIKNGIVCKNRTGIDTRSIIGAKMEFDISQSIPLMTTRQIPFKTIVEELLWFCRGDTDAKILQARGVNIWNGNTSREFLDSRGLQHYPEGVLGAGYGFQWRHFGSQYSPDYADMSKLSINERQNIGGIDQLENLVHLLKTDPFSRQIVLSVWNPCDLDKVALPPCHPYLQFLVRYDANNINKNDKKILNCVFFMRSSDSLAWSYNVVSYSILTYILALKCNMKPGTITYMAGDCHIYVNHLKQIKDQMSRTPRPAPKLYLDKSIKVKDWSEITTDDISIIGYFPHSSIKMDMAI